MSTQAVSVAPDDVSWQKDSRLLMVEPAVVWRMRDNLQDARVFDCFWVNGKGKLLHSQTEGLAQNGESTCKWSKSQVFEDGPVGGLAAAFGSHKTNFDLNNTWRRDDSPWLAVYWSSGFKIHQRFRDTITQGWSGDTRLFSDRENPETKMARNSPLAAVAVDRLRRNLYYFGAQGEVRVLRLWSDKFDHVQSTDVQNLLSLKASQALPPQDNGDSSYMVANCVYEQDQSLLFEYVVVVVWSGKDGGIFSHSIYNHNNVPSDRTVRVANDGSVKLNTKVPFVTIPVRDGHLYLFYIHPSGSIRLAKLFWGSKAWTESVEVVKQGALDGLTAVRRAEIARPYEWDLFWIRTDGSMGNCVWDTDFSKSPILPVEEHVVRLNPKASAKPLVATVAMQQAQVGAVYADDTRLQFCLLRAIDSPENEAVHDLTNFAKDDDHWEWLKTRMSGHDQVIVTSLESINNHQVRLANRVPKMNFKDLKFSQGNYNLTGNLSPFKVEHRPHDLSNRAAIYLSVGFDEKSYLENTLSHQKTFLKDCFLVLKSWYRDGKKSNVTENTIDISFHLLHQEASSDIERTQMPDLLSSADASLLCKAIEEYIRNNLPAFIQACSLSIRSNHGSTWPLREIKVDAWAQHDKDEPTLVMAGMGFGRRFPPALKPSGSWLQSHSSTTVATSRHVVFTNYFLPKLKSTIPATLKMANVIARYITIDADNEKHSVGENEWLLPADRNVADTIDWRLLDHLATDDWEIRADRIKAIEDAQLEKTDHIVAMWSTDLRPKKSKQQEQDEPNVNPKWSEPRTKIESYLKYYPGCGWLTIDSFIDVTVEHARNASQIRTLIKLEGGADRVITVTVTDSVHNISVGARNFDVSNISGSQLDLEDWSDDALKSLSEVNLAKSLQDAFEKMNTIVLPGIANFNSGHPVFNLYGDLLVPISWEE